MNIRLLLLLALFFLILKVNSQVYDKPISINSNSAFDEGEAHIAIDPNDSLKMVVGYMESGQTGVRFKVYQSSDGGNNWQPSTLNTISIANSDYPNHNVIGGGDIVLAYDKTGALYCSWIHLLANFSIPNAGDSVLWRSYWAKSMDNGNTFSLSSGNDRFFGEGKIGLVGGITIHNYKDGICDRQWLTTDLSNGSFSNRLYVGYINYPFNLQQSGLRIKVKDTNQTAFSSPTTAYPGSGQFTNLLVDSSGVLHYTFCDVDSNHIYHVSSSDGGNTFTTPHLIYSGNDLAPTTTTIHDRENAAPSLAIDGNNNLHLVWGDFVSGLKPQAYYSKSLDGGLTWSSSQSLNNLFGSDILMPVVSAKRNRVTIGGNVLDSSNKSEYYITSSVDHGITFGSPIKVSSGITDYNSIGNAFVGDYSSSVRTNCNIYSLWTDCRAIGCVQYIAKYNECLATGIVDLTPVKASIQLNKIYPMPAEDNLNISIYSEQNGLLSASIYSIEGKIVDNVQFNLSRGENHLKFDLDQIPSSQYILKLETEDGTFITRSIIVN